jgi:hypothetical protein
MHLNPESLSFALLISDLGSIARAANILGCQSAFNFDPASAFNFDLIKRHSKSVRSYRLILILNQNLARYGSRLSATTHIRPQGCVG